MQRVLSPRDLKGSTFSLSAGETLPREKLTGFLEQTGYQNERLVEERGDFSVRGAIVDIFSPLFEEPLRLEFDGDRLLSIRRFETATQRSLPGKNLDRALLLPARDAPSDSQSPPLGSLFSYLSRNAVILTWDAEGVKRGAESFSTLVREHYERARQKSRVVAPPESLYLDPYEFSISLSRFQILFLEEGPLGPPESRHVASFPAESNRTRLVEVPRRNPDWSG